ncbi:disintegrin and metalloproteinase domain-containing protein 12 [Gracilinanus agilis]|uniref:disintegrin and metalloproteinase domain-containing protein 12 n=1 Tax=Gracilinanus agilis TaxID=191870 RepID=UPI001CFC57DD|nr:disintegrin and metalloproteinase domain-containing protein 12 [Gracilinanus agilis]
MGQLSRAPSPRTRSQSPRGPAPQPLTPPLPLLLLPLLLLPAAFPAQGVIVESPLGASGLPTRTRDHSDGYEIVSPSLLNGEPWDPLSSSSSKGHPVGLSFRIEVDGKELIIHLERNEGLLADNFTATHYRRDGTDVSLAQNDTMKKLRGLILLGSQAYILEPLKEAAGKHKFQPAETLKTAWGSCGQQQLNVSGRTVDGAQWSPHVLTRRHKRETLKTTKYVELVIVADNREFQRQGKDVEKVKQRLIEIANHVDKGPFKMARGSEKGSPLENQPTRGLKKIGGCRKAKAGHGLIPLWLIFNIAPYEFLKARHGLLGHCPEPWRNPIRESPRRAEDSGPGVAERCLWNSENENPLTNNPPPPGITSLGSVSRSTSVYEMFTLYQGRGVMQRKAGALTVGRSTRHSPCDRGRGAGLSGAVIMKEPSKIASQAPACSQSGIFRPSIHIFPPAETRCCGVYFQGTTIGMAPIMSMCTAEQSGGVVMDHSDSPLGAAVTLAHELGHNLGMNHDTLERGCHCQSVTDKGGCIMNPSTGYPFPMMFSSCSKRDLETSLEKGMGMCLFNLPNIKESFGGQKCGNGYVEEGEECDCGEPDECTNPCCNATTCTLKPEAVCAHGLCCENCQLKPAGTACRASSNSCDLPEFCTGANPHCPANVYLHDGHQCHRVDGYCYNGICQTHEQQCITLWGPGKGVPGGAGQSPQLGGWLAGGLHCPALSDGLGLQAAGGVRDHIWRFVYSSGHQKDIMQLYCIQKTCRTGSHESLFLSYDPMLCLNRRCQNISVFGVHECATKCHGRGVCNSNKNCHCEADWAPPFCDKPGFGGSIDSGPIRQADKRGLTVGILVTFLCLGAAAFVTYLKRKTLIRLLFTNKKTKTTIEKLRCVSPARPSGVVEPNRARTTNLSHGLLRKPPATNTPKENCRRLPKYQNIDISNPVKTLDSSLPFHQGPSHQNVPVRPLPANPPIRQTQGTQKPSPPQKPLPADPLSRTARLSETSRRTPGQQEPGHRIVPIRLVLPS